MNPIKKLPGATGEFFIGTTTYKRCVADLPAIA